MSRPCIIESFSTPNGKFCIGQWVCTACGWQWEGTCRSINGGWVGNPFSGYQLIPKPVTPCQSAPAVQPPPQPAPPVGEPHETAPPKPQDIPPPESCGGSMATVSEEHFEGRYGYKRTDLLAHPIPAKFLGLNKYASVQTRQGETLFLRTRPNTTNVADIGDDYFHPATGAGEIWLSPSELEDYNLAGELTAFTGKLPNGALPKRISKVGLNIPSFVRSDPTAGDDVDGYFGMGAYHPSGTYVADGWIQKLSGSAGARQLNFYPTDYDAALTDGKPVKIWGTLDVTGNINSPSVGVVEEISTNGSDLGSFSTIDVGSESAMFIYEVLGWNDPDGQTISAEGVITVEGGSLMAVNRSTLSHAGGVTVSVSTGLITVSVTNVRSATDTTCWTLRYKTLIRGAC